ncbi:hypothetical protein D3C84_1188120 [compost metagenome]
MEPGQCLVFEDATVGILAAEAAGADLVIVTATHEQPIETVHGTLVDYDMVRVQVDAAGLRLHAV